MDNKIDWSLAPKWSNAVVADYDGDYWYVEEFGVVSKRRQRLDEFRPDGDIADMTTSYHSWKLVSERHKQWSGPEDGLPPVGFRCEAGIPHTSSPDNEVSIIWIEGSVIAYYKIKGNAYAWFAEDDGFYPPAVLEFRAIRTPEQIAHELRESKIVEFMNTVGIECRVTATKAVDAGYVREVV